MNDLFKFQPLSFSWAAIHPQPKGTIEFIGGAFFGGFPTVFYRYFLKRLFAEPISRRFLELVTIQFLDILKERLNEEI